MTDKQTERTRAVDLAMLQIEKQFGKGSILRLGTKEVVPVSVISTGSLSFDYALGVGGMPRGRVVEIFGPEASGKTTLALHVIAEAQKQKGTAAFIDAEHALDPAYAGKLGVDIDSLLVSQPDYGEQALDIAEVLVRSGGVDVVVVDSVAALVPRAELEGEMGESHVGRQARLMSQALRKLTGIVFKSNTCFVFINQIREKIGVMFGNPETTTGGRALKFYSSVRVDIRRIAAIKEGDLLDLGVDKRLIEKSGAWFSYGGERIGQGRETARLFLKENPDIRNKIENELRAALSLPKINLSERAPAEPTPVRSRVASS